MRLTTAPNASRACSTNAGVTPAPPEEMRRSDRTRSAENRAADMRVTKNVGGPIMKLMRSSAMIPSASPGSHLSMRTVRIPATPGSSTPLRRPEMCARGAGMSTASSLVRAWTSHMRRAL